MRKMQGQLINQTLEFWQARSLHKLTREDAREIMENITGFFRVLQKWESTGQPPPNHKETAEKELRLAEETAITRHTLGKSAAR